MIGGLNLNAFTPENRLPMLDVINFALDRFNEKPGQLPK